MIKATLNQIILYVKDMPGAVHFYRDVLGLTVRYPQGKEDYAQEMWVELDAGSCSLALHGVAKRSPDSQHELIFTVDDLETARQMLLTAGVKMGEIRILENGKPIASGVDPAGHPFSIR